MQKTLEIRAEYTRPRGTIGEIDGIRVFNLARGDAVLPIPLEGPDSIPEPRLSLAPYVTPGGLGRGDLVSARTGSGAERLALLARSLAPWPEYILVVAAQQPTPPPDSWAVVTT